jgi:hypothetical protein
LQSVFLVTVLAVFFLFFGALQDFLLSIKVASFLSNSFSLFTCFLIAEILFTRWIKKKNPGLTKHVMYLVFVFAALITIEIVSLLLTVYKGKTISSVTKKMSPSLPTENINAERPDIYHILFDSYTNAPILQQYWGYKNDIYPFLDSSGFYTIDSAFSNYDFTPYSVSSVFNMDYLEGAEEFITPNSANFYIGNRVYHNNALFKFLEKQEYRFSIFSILEKEERLLDLGFLAVGPPESWLRKQTLERIYLNPWMTHKIKSRLSKNGKLPEEIIESMQNFRNYNKEATEHIFSDCKNASQAEAKQTPVFSFTHLMLPHGPYLVDENGAYLPNPDPTGSNKEGYLQQIKYANKLIRQITDCLLSDTSHNKIIIFQGDHGYRQDNNSPYATKYGALNAVYFYNKNYQGMKKDLSLVNTYRLVFNNVFHGNLHLLKDSIVLKKTE